jgi:hypothetical protein
MAMDVGPVVLGDQGELRLPVTCAGCRFNNRTDCQQSRWIRLRAVGATTRTSFELDGGRLEIDGWPLIPPYLETEADSRDEVVRIAAILGFAETDLTGEKAARPAVAALRG